MGNGPNYYSNPYSPLGGANHYNPAVTIATANNNLPQQPPLHAPLISTPTPTATVAPATATAATPTVVIDLPAGGSIANPGPSPLTVILLILAAIILIAVLSLIGVAILRARRS